MIKQFKNYLLNTKDLSLNTALQYSRRLNQAYSLGFDPADHNALKAEQWVQDRGGTSVNHDSWTMTFKHYHSFLKHTKGLDLPFADNLKLKHRPRRLPKPVPYNDLVKIIDSIETISIEGCRNKAILELLYCGLRNAEVCNIKLQNVVDHEVKVIGKGDKERLVPINEQAWQSLCIYALRAHGNVTNFQEIKGLSDTFVMLKQLLINEPDLLLFKTATGIRLNERRVREIVANAAKAAGIKYRVHPHMLRHSFATHTLDSGLGNLIALQDVMGIDSADIMRRYVLTTNKSRNQVLAHHPRQINSDGLVHTSNVVSDGEGI